MTMMTEKQAFATMFFFLEQLYRRTKNDELGGLLGSMSPLPDGWPADAAIQADWRDAVEHAAQGEEPQPLALNK